MGEIRLGILPWGQATDWPSMESTARRVEELGYDHLWAWDHLHASFGDPDQPIYEGWLRIGGRGVASPMLTLNALRVLNAAGRRLDGDVP